MVKDNKYQKDCQNCGKVIHRPTRSWPRRHGISNLQWSKVMFCSLKCFGPYISKKNKGKAPPNKGSEKSMKYGALHARFKKKLPKPKVCSSCGKKKPLDLANISGKYLNEIKDWEYICRKCHMTKDGRIHTWQKNSIKKL